MFEITIGSHFLPPGGMLSGFFGGLSGHQGALRSVLLLCAGPGKEGYIATGIAVAVLIDISRLLVYGNAFFSRHFLTLGDDSYSLILIDIVSAFAGSFSGRKILKKIELPTIHLVVSVMIFLIALLIGSGII